MKAKRKVEEISKDDVQAFLKKNAFVLFTVGAVVVGMDRNTWREKKEEPHRIGKCLSEENCVLLSLQVSFWASRYGL